MIKIDIRKKLELIKNYRDIAGRNIGLSKQLISEIREWHEDLIKKIPSNVEVQIIFEKFIIILNKTNFGNVSHAHLLGPHELIIFDNYINRRIKNRIAIDMGANIGMHTILLSKLGYEVHAYEPDPKTFECLQLNLKSNKCEAILYNSAVTSESFIINGYTNFTRVIDHPTSSGLSNTEKKFYGNIENLKVKAVKSSNIIKDAGILKIDVEGSESIILENLIVEENNYEYINIEISGDHSREIIFKKMKEVKKYEWYTDKIQLKNPKKNLLPLSWRDGSLHLIMKKREKNG